MAAAAEAGTQIPVEGVDASSLDEIEPAQRTVECGEWWCVNFGTMQSIRSKEGCVLFFGVFFFLLFSEM